jgi:hypothetical protein
VQPHRIELREHDADLDGQWVDIHPRQTYGMRLEIRRAVRQRGADGTVDFDLQAADLKALEVAIVAWSFPESVSASAIEALDGELGDWLQEQVREVYNSRRRTPEETKSAAD